MDENFALFTTSQDISQTRPSFADLHRLVRMVIADAWHALSSEPLASIFLTTSFAAAKSCLVIFMGSDSPVSDLCNSLLALLIVSASVLQL